nr:unnamed protein product [Callosobruchus analis]
MISLITHPNGLRFQTSIFILNPHINLNTNICAVLKPLRKLDVSSIRMTRISYLQA